MFQQNQGLDHPVQGILQRNEKYLRLKTMLNHSGHELYCYLLLHPNYGGFQRQPDLVYNELLSFKEGLQIFKLNGIIDAKEFDSILYPDSQETYLRECSLNLLHVLCNVCIKDFPDVDTLPSVDDEELQHSSLEIMAIGIEKLTKMAKELNEEEIQQNLSDSRQLFESMWDEAIEILVSLDYDVSKVEDIKTINDVYDSNCQEAYLRSQIELLVSECSRLLEMTKSNSTVLTKLKDNLFEVMLLVNDRKKLEGKEAKLTVYDIDDLHYSVRLTKDTLNEHVELLLSLIPDLKLVKMKNVEGEIIVIDEKLSKLSIRVAKDSQKVEEYFNKISRDVMEIKESAALIKTTKC